MATTLPIEPPATIDDVYRNPQDWSILGVVDGYLIYVDDSGRSVSVSLRTKPVSVQRPKSTERNRTESEQNGA